MRTLLWGCLGLVACRDLPAAADPKALARPIESLPSERDGRLIRHVMGETRVPAHPTRIVSLSYVLTDALIQLERPPVASPLLTSMAEGMFPDYQRPHLREVSGLTVLPNAGLEAIAQLEPDLILTGEWPMTTLFPAYEALARVAPTVFIGADEPTQQVLDVGKVLGLEAEAHRIVAAHQHRLADGKRRLAAHAGETIMLLRLHQKQYRLQTGPKNGGRLLGALGFQLAKPPFVPPPGVPPGTLRIDEEMLPQIEVHRLFVFVDPPAFERTRLRLAESPLWGQIPAVRAGRAHFVSGAFNFSSVLAQQQTLEEVLVILGAPP